MGSVSHNSLQLEDQDAGGKFSSCRTSQNTALLLVSAFIVSGRRCGVPVECLAVSSGVARCWLSGAPLGVTGFLTTLFLYV